MKEIIRTYFREPGDDSQPIRNSWIDIFRVWPLLNVLLLFGSLACLLSKKFGTGTDPLLAGRVYLVTAISVTMEAIHFLGFMGLHYLFRPKS